MAFPEEVAAALVNHQFLGLVGPLIDILRAAGGQILVSRPVNQQKRPGRKVTRAECAVRLAGEPHHRLDIRAHRTRLDDHRAAKGVSHQSDVAYALLLEKINPHQHVKDAFAEITGLAVVEAERVAVWQVFVNPEPILAAMRIHPAGGNREPG